MKLLFSALSAVLFAILVMGSAVGVFGQGTLAPDIYPVFTNVNGVTPVALGFICTTTSGTNTPLATYQDAGLSIPNFNPLTLNASGRNVNGTTLEPIFLQGKNYRFTLYAAGTGNTCNSVTVGALIWQLDAINGQVTSFIQGGAGAITRTITSKLQDTVSILDFGATCTGAGHDDTAGIQLAYDYVGGTLGGGVVEFPNGATCYITSLPFNPYAIRLRYNNVTLEGNNATITDTLASSAGQAIFGRTFATSYEAATGYAVATNVATGGLALTLTTVGQAANFNIGDAIYIRTGSLVDGATNGEINQAETVNVSTGVLTFRWPTSKALVNNGVNPYVVADVQAFTVYNTIFQNFTFKDHILPFALGQSINTITRNIQSYTLDALIPGPPTIQADHVRSFLIDHWSVYLPHSCAAALYQLAVSIDVTISNSSLVSNDVACTLLNFSDYSAQADVHDNFLGGVGQIAGSNFNDVNIHDNVISINTQTGLPPIDLEVGGTNNPGINIHSNRMNFPGTSPSLVIGGSQFRFTDNTILSGSTARVLSITSNASAGTGGVITSNTITCTAGCTAIEVDGTIHDQVISGNNLKGPGLGTGTGIAVANSNTTTTSNTITSNTISGFANGINITTVANEPLVTILGNNVSNTTTPFNPNTFNTAGLVAWGRYTPGLTAVANIGTSAAYQAQWLRVGNAVTVSGRVDITAALSGGTATSLGISQPTGQTSVFTAPNECGGAAMSSVNGAPLVVAAAVLANVANANCEIDYNAIDTNAHGVWYQYTYQIRPP